MESQHQNQHTIDFGHNLIVPEVSAEWDGFCFNCSLEYLFSRDVPLDLDQRFKVADLLRQCLSDIESIMCLDLVHGAVVDSAHKFLYATGAEEDALWILLAVERLNIKGKYLVNSTTALFGSLSGRMYTTPNWWIIAMHLRLIRLEDYLERRTSECIEFLFSVIEIEKQRRRENDSLRWTVLKMESIITAAHLLNANSSTFAVQPERVVPLYRYTSAVNAVDVMEFMTTELCADYSELFRKTKRDTIVYTSISFYRANIFYFIHCLMRIDAVFQALLVEILGKLTGPGKILLQKLSRSAICLFDNSRREADNIKFSGIDCVATIIEINLESLSPLCETKETLGRHLMADDSAYICKLFGLWDWTYQQNDNSLCEGTERLSYSIVHSHFLLMSSCPERYYHYSIFTATVCSTLFTHYVSSLSVLRTLRSVGGGTLAILGSIKADSQSTCFDRTVSEVQDIICTALQRNAIGRAVSSTIVSGITDFIDTIDEAKSFATFCVLSHALPVQLRLLQSSVLSLTQHSAVVIIAWQSLLLLVKALCKPVMGSISALCLYERQSALLFCADCIEYCLPEFSMQAYEVVQICDMCGELLSYMCIALSDMMDRTHSRCSKPSLRHNSSKIELTKKRAFLSIVQFIGKLGKDVVLRQLFCKGYNCRTIHSTLAQYIILQLKAPDEDNTFIWKEYIQFLVVCCESILGNAPEGNITNQFHSTFCNAAAQFVSGTVDVAGVNELDVLCSLYFQVSIRPSTTALYLHDHLECSYTSVPSQLPEMRTVTDPVVKMTALILSLLPDPVEAYGAAPFTINYFLLQITTAFNVTDLKIPEHLAAVLSSFLLLRTLTLTIGSTQFYSIACITQNFLLSSDVAELTEYWIACTKSDTTTIPAQLPFTAYMLDLFMNFSISAKHHVDKCTTGNVELVKLITATAKRIPFCKMTVAIEKLYETTERLSTPRALHSKSLQQHSKMIWNAVLVILRSVRVQLTFISTESQSRIGDPRCAESALQLSNVMLKIFLNAVLTIPKVNQDSCVEGAKKNDDAISEVSTQSLTPLLNEVLIDQFVSAALVFIQVKDKSFNSTAGRFGSPEREIKRGSTESELISELSEYLRRSGWWQLAQSHITKSNENPCYSSVLLYVVQICVFLNNTSIFHAQELSKIEILRSELLIFIAEPVNRRHTLQNQVRSTADRIYFSSICLAAVVLCCSNEHSAPSQRSLTGEELKNAENDIYKVLSCWLIACQEELLISTPHQSQEGNETEVQDIDVLAVQEQRKSALLYCNAHLVWEQRQQPPQQIQPFHSLWMEAVPSTPTDQLLLCSLPDDSRYSTHCHAIYHQTWNSWGSENGNNSILVMEEVLQCAAQIYTVASLLT